MSDTPKSLFTFDVVTIKSAGKLEAISEILTWQISTSTPLFLHNSTTLFTVIV